MVPAQEYLGDAVVLPFPGEDLRTGVDIVPGDTALFDGGIFPEDAGNTAGDAVEHHHCRQLAAREGVGPDGDGFSSKYFLDTCINALVAAADHNEVLVLRRHLFCIRGVELRAARLEKYDLHMFAILAAQRFVYGTEHAFRLEYHTGPPAVWPAVNARVPVFCEVAWVVERDLDLLALDRTLHDRLAQIRVEGERKEGDNVEMHRRV